MAPASVDPYADVDMQGTPQWLATRLIGPYTIAYSAQLLLFGLFAQQFLNFVSSGEFSRLPKKTSKAVLVALFSLNLVYTAITIYEQWEISVRQERTLDAIIALNPTWNLLPLIAGWIAALTQAFLAVRAASFIPNRKLKIGFYVWMGLLILLGLGGSTLVCGLGTLWNVRGGLAVLPFGWNNAVAIWCVATACADVSVTVALTFSLRKRIAGFNVATDSLLKQLIWLALRTASYTAILSLVGAVVGFIWTDGDYATCNISIALWYPMSALYGISVFTTVSSSRRAINTSIGPGISTLNASVGTKDMFALPSASAFAGGPRGDGAPQGRFGPFRNSVVSGMPMNPAPAATGEPRPGHRRTSSAQANRNSLRYSIHVETSVEEHVDEPDPKEGYEQFRLSLGKEGQVKRWRKGDEEKSVGASQREKEDEAFDGVDPLDRGSRSSLDLVV
ncbi:hypothetical protein JCM10207_005667 [Rhodosporidiobolus poonsookiae]